MALGRVSLGDHGMSTLGSKLQNWFGAFRIYLQPVCLRMFFLGFSAGLPLLLVLGTLGFWLREAGIDLKTIGFMSWIGLVYGCKWLWAPLVDNLKIPYFSAKLGQRRTWLILSQLMLMLSLSGMAFSDPRFHLPLLTFFAFLTAFASATQDISLDAYRIESADTDLQGALAATYQTGYRIAMIWAGAGAFALAALFQTTPDSVYDQKGWTVAYLIMAASIGVGLLTSILSPAPNKIDEADKLRELREVKSKVKEFVRTHDALPQPAAKVIGWLKVICWSPIADFFDRYKWHVAAILLLIATYRISDVVMGVMSNPFYRDLGFSKEEVAAVSKIFGVVMTLVGTFVGGVVVLRLGVLKTLFIGALLASATNLLFSCLAGLGHDLAFLVFTVSADNLSGGLASAAFIAYLSGLTNVRYSATQYAVFSSIMLILPKFLAGFSGVMVESVGYANFFIITAALGIPVLILIPVIGMLEKSKH